MDEEVNQDKNGEAGFRQRVPDGRCRAAKGSIRKVRSGERLVQ